MFFLNDIMYLRKRKKGGEIMFDRTKFKAALVLAGKTNADVAAALGVNESTLYRRLVGGGNFRRNEIQTLVDFLQIENPSEIFFAG